MNGISDHVFRAYDIRGVVGEGIDEDFAYQLGRVLAHEIGVGTRVGIGRDCRSHGLALQTALMDGLKKEGCHPVDFGMVPSPVVYFAVYNRDVPIDLGVVVTAATTQK